MMWDQHDDEDYEDDDADEGLMVKFGRAQFM